MGVAGFDVEPGVVAARRIEVQISSIQRAAEAQNAEVAILLNVARIRLKEVITRIAGRSVIVGDTRNTSRTDILHSATHAEAEFFFHHSGEAHGGTRSALSVVGVVAG